MGSLKTEAYEREMKGKKENQTNTKSNIIIIYVPSKKKEKAQTHPMPQQNIFFHHCSHPHVPPKSDK
jgi:hypothetical protein